MALPRGRVRVQPERRGRGTDDLGWLPAALPAPMEDDLPDGTPERLWRGRVTLSPLNGRTESRLLVLEDDFFAADGPAAGELVAARPVVFSEAIALNDLLEP